MTESPDSEQIIQGPEGVLLCTPAYARKRLGKSAAEIDTLIAKGQLTSCDDSALLSKVKGRGRRPKVLLELHGVESLRLEILAELGVADEVRQLKQELAAARSGWDADSTALRSRISDLEGTLEGLLEAIERRFQAFDWQIRADRRWIDLVRNDSRLKLPPSVPGGTGSEPETAV